MNRPNSGASNSYKRFKQTCFKIIKVTLLVIGLSLAPTLAFADAVSFEWSMPERLLENTTMPGADPADPVPEYDPNALMLPPGGWRVDLDACAIAPNIVSYEWFVDGASVGVVTECAFAHQFPQENTYIVTLKVTYDNAATDLFEQSVTVQDWLIIALGDSYASGEGNPEVPVTEAGHIDLSLLTDIVDSVKADLQAKRDALLGAIETKEVKQTLRDDAMAIRDQAAVDLSVLQADLNALLVIETNVENDPVVISARANVDYWQALVDGKQGEVTYWQGQVAAAQHAYNNCSGIVDCANKLFTLTSAQASLATAKTALAADKLALETAEATLLAARTAAVLIYSAIGTIQNFGALSTALADAQTAVNNFKTGTFDLAQQAYQNAEDALQDAIAIITNLQGLIAALEQDWEDAKIDVLTHYLDTLPMWTATPPSWAEAEPTYAEIVLNHVSPGKAMRCHRSMLSGQARAALAIEQADPHTSVTLVHLSCTGAQIDRGLLEGYGAASPIAALSILIEKELIDGTTLQEAMPQLFNLPDIEPQVCVAADTVRGREVDAIVTSIGGNDLGFAKIIEQCIAGEPCHDPDALPPSDEFTDAQILAVEQNCSPGVFINFLTGWSLPTGHVSFTEQCLSVYDSTLQTSTPGEALAIFNDKSTDIDVDKAGNRWEELNTKLVQQFPALDSRRIYFTEYPDPTSDDSGNYCSWNPSQTTTLGEELKGLPGVTEAELTWADITVATALRDLTKAASDFYQWIFISETGVGAQTISSESKTHGYCADDRWLYTVPGSLVNQLDHFGAVHPNRDGHGLYKRAIFNQLKNDFYPTGLSGAPRAPDSTQIAPPGKCVAEVLPPVDEPVASDDPAASEETTVTGGSSSGGSLSPWLLLFLSTCWYLRRITCVPPVVSMSVVGR